MRFFSAIVGSALLQLAVSVAIPGSAAIEPIEQRTTITPPTEDPFYTPPPDLSSSKPGAILKTRSVGPLSFIGLVPYTAKATYQLMYRTTDSQGNASATVTTIIVPHNANFSRILSYQYSEDASWLNCAPSYTVQLGSNPANFGSNGVETLFLIAGLNQGWIINLPDYQGPTSAFTSGLQAGQATLDSIRATLSSGLLTGVSRKAEYQMWGYSGGSLASEWAAELQPSYAPELNFKGVALGGLVPNVTSVMVSTNKSLFGGLIPAGILGLASAYPELETYLNQHLIPSKRDDFYAANGQCLGANAATYAGQDMYSYFDIGQAVFTGTITAGVLEKTGQMGTHGTPRMPIFAYKAIGDEISVVADTDALYTKLCAQGANILYHRDAIGEHATEEITGSGDAFGFLVDRFNGKPFQKGCTCKNVLSDLLSAPGAAYLGVEVVGGLLAVLGLPVGNYIH